MINKCMAETSVYDKLEQIAAINSFIVTKLIIWTSRLKQTQKNERQTETDLVVSNKSLEKSSHVFSFC